MKLIDKVKVFAIAGILAVAGILTLGSASVYATPQGLNEAKTDVTTGASGSGMRTDANLQTIIGNVIKTILYIVGIIAVVMVIFGGVQYATSAGDTAKVTKAKNTILYGLVGMVIAILAYVIVNFVIEGLGTA